MQTFLAFEGDNRLIVTVRNSRTKTAINDATVTAYVLDPSNSNAQIGDAITCSYIAGSNGEYRGIIPYTLAVTRGKRYIVKALIIATVDGGERRQPVYDEHVYFHRWPSAR